MRRVAEEKLGAPEPDHLRFETLAELRAACLRAWHLFRALPDAPETAFEADLKREGQSWSGPESQDFDPNRATTREAQVRLRVGQNTFRAALDDYWGGRCPLTGITDRALLRASHIVPWAECKSDGQRLNVFNGLLLAAHWDAAFDALVFRQVSDFRQGVEDISPFDVGKERVGAGLRADTRNAGIQRGLFPVGLGCIAIQSKQLQGFLFKAFLFGLEIFDQRPESEFRDEFRLPLGMLKGQLGQGHQGVADIISIRVLERDISDELHPEFFRDIRLAAAVGRPFLPGIGIAGLLHREVVSVSGHLELPHELDPLEKRDAPGLCENDFPRFGREIPEVDVLQERWAKLDPECGIVILGRGVRGRVPGRGLGRCR